MPEIKPYIDEATSLEQLAQTKGFCLLEFGTNWCGHCQGAQAVIAEAFADEPNLLHIKQEDGPGRPLGRHFKVKLWPTLVLLKDGAELAKVVRPTTLDDIRPLLKHLRQP